MADNCAAPTPSLPGLAPLIECTELEVALRRDVSNVVGIAAALALAICAGQPVRAQDANAQPTNKLSIELNKLEPLDKGCRAYVVLDNASAVDYEALKLDLFMFRTDGVIGRRFAIDERVIIPRSFIGELLVRDPTVLAPESDAVRRVLDLCTGSGCLAILAAEAFPDATIDAVDMSADALDVARRNVADYALNERIELVSSDLFDGLAGRRTLELITALYESAATGREVRMQYRPRAVRLGR